ncbi:NADH-quinone oxidoreductase subunit A [Friedmanniella endophytica]|uniref:NADH-quinone oxidoreductase subunit n=1 Tax=Microlunatus kandeliicorticis TaxID=1759536 RepID=A0A7W3IPK7_9ACTN|nr:NADH-quinone oxidoreductase subunit A [Microlunatus kandeliicorticis]MBA8792889.1 NADH-quinone oxidoreductase subunit A [Microlunatus kandeliicorticis]
MQALPVLALLIVGSLGLAVLYAGHRLLYREPAAVALPFLSGLAPSEHALSRYHARWYVATLLFLAFDVEMLFMYPWTLVVAMEGIGAVTEMFVFLGVLLVGVVWAWREGALRWA